MTVFATALAFGLLLGQVAGTVEIRDIAPEHHPTVNALVRVVDQRGRAVPGLGRGDFTLTEDGAAITDFEVRPSFREGGSLAVVLLVDTSFSMRGAPLEGAKNAARAFLDRLGPDDRVGLVTFGVPPVERAAFGPPASVSGIEGLTAAGYTGLYDAVNLGVAKLSAQTATARAVIVLTDGGDDGSSVSFEAIRQVVASAALPVHAVGFQSPEFSGPPMQELAAISRGSYRETADPAELATLYRQIADELVAEYRITYRSAAPAGRHQLGIVAGLASGRVSGEQSYDVIAGAPGTAAPPAEPAAVDSTSTPLVPLVAGLAVLVVAALSVVVVKARRAQARPIAAAPVGRAAQPLPTSDALVLEGTGVTIPLTGGELLVGRDPTAQVIVDDPTVSRYHARLQLRADGLWVEDLGSSNGTLVNGVRVEGGLMQSGDVLDIGDLRLVLRRMPA